jgi:DNA-binding LytR/AlgR family response regulator
MLNIAICDDAMKITNQVEDFLLEISNKHLVEIETDIYYSGEELLKALFNDFSYDIIFLDIELDLIDGIQVGKKIREEFENEYTKIAYISAKESYAMELFQVRPIDFLVKPLDIEKVESVFLTALKLIEKTNRYFTYKTGQYTNKVQIKDILYFESSNRKINIITTKETYTFYATLDEIEEQVIDFDFLRIHKSYLINYEHVVTFQYDQVALSSETILSISQTRRKDIRKKILLLENKGDKHEF